MKFSKADLIVHLFQVSYDVSKCLEYKLQDTNLFQCYRTCSKCKMADLLLFIYCKVSHLCGSLHLIIPLFSTDLHSFNIYNIV